MTTALSTGIRRAAARIAPDPAPDGELLSRFLAARDEAAFAVLVRRHAAMVFGTCRRVLGNAPDADDAFQAAFVVLVRKAHSLTDRACVGNFLYGVAFHTALKARAMATKRKAKEGRAKFPQPTSTDTELTIILDEELARLPEKYREPVVLCELEGVSRKDAAGRLGVPEGTISSRLATAHRMLAKRLKARGFAVSGIAAVLGGQAFAVSDSLADAAVRAAVDGPPAGVTHLAAEVTKMFLLNKLKMGTAVLAGVVLLLGAGVGFIQRGVAADDKAGLKAPVPKKDEKPKDADAIQGTWVVTEWKQTGVAQAEGLKKVLADGGFKITFTADTMTYEFDKSSLKYSLDPLKDPKQVQLLTPGGGIALGIYELNGDDLKLCIGRTELAKGGKPAIAPAAFDTDKAQPGTSLFVMKRAKEEKKDEDRIQGLWQAESLEAQGQKAPDEAVAKFRIRFRGNAITFVEGDQDRDRSHTFELDPKASPKAMNLTAGDGPAKGKKLDCAIYDLDGDTLRICMDKEGQAGQRPTEFKTAPNSGFALMVLKRVKEEKKDDPKKKQAKKPDDATAILGTWAESSSAEFPPRVFAPTDRVFKAKNRWTFAEGGKLTSVSTVTGETHTSERQFELNPAASPKELTLTGDGLKLTWSYELNGDTLKVALGGDGKVRPPSIDPKDIPQGVAVTVIEFTRVKDDRPADKEYSLKDGEVLKLIPAPFPAGREKVFDRIPAGKRSGSPFDTNLLAVSVGDGSAEVSEFTARRCKAGDPVKPPQLLQYVKHLIGIDTATVSDPNWLLESTVLDADVIIRKGAKPEELLAALSRELKAKCGIDVTFTFREVETEVVVLSGKHTLTRTHAFPGRPYNDAARVALTDKPLAGSGGRGSAQLPAELATFVGRPVVDESDLKSNAVAVWITSPSYDTRPQAADRDPQKVLQSLANQTGLTVKLGKQKVRVLVVEQPGQAAKQPVEPAWKAAFRKAYGLADGQLVRRVAPPYPDSREEYFKALWPNRQGNIPFDQWFVVLGWKGDWTQEGVGGFTMPIKPDEGVTLERLLDMTLKVPKTRIESDATSLERKVTGDFVVRAGADPEKVAVQLEAVLRKELELPVKFAFKDAEEEVFVLSGKYAAKPVDDRKANEIEVYANHLTERGVGGGGSGTLAEMLAAVERHVSKPVVLGKVEGGPAEVSWHYNVRSPMLRDPAKGIDTYRDDTNPAQVLGRLADQTGLTVTTEKRKVRVLVVQHEEVKK